MYELEFDGGHQFLYEKLPSMKKLKHRNDNTVKNLYLSI